ncbi:hypothetical protein D3C73_1423610 [compost metagenome]
MIKTRQILHQHAKAHGITGNHIQIDMQPAVATRQQTEADITGDTLFQRQHLAAFRQPFFGKPVGNIGSVRVAKIVQMQAMLRAAGGDSLLAIGGDLQA